MVRWSYVGLTGGRLAGRCHAVERRAVGGHVMAGQRDHSIEMRDLAANTARTGGLNCGKVDMTLKCRRVRFWHKADIAWVRSDVRFQGQSGRCECLMILEATP